MIDAGYDFDPNTLELESDHDLMIMFEARCVLAAAISVACCAMVALGFSVGHLPRLVDRLSLYFHTSAFIIFSFIFITSLIINAAFLILLLRGHKHLVCEWSKSTKLVLFLNIYQHGVMGAFDKLYEPPTPSTPTKSSSLYY